MFFFVFLSQLISLCGKIMFPQSSTLRFSLFVSLLRLRKLNVCFWLSFKLLSWKVQLHLYYITFHTHFSASTLIHTLLFLLKRSEPHKLFLEKWTTWWECRYSTIVQVYIHIHNHNLPFVDLMRLSDCVK